MNVQVLVYTRQGKSINKNIVTEQLTTKQTELAPKGERDAFDTLFDHGPDKLQHVKSLFFCGFCKFPLKFSTEHEFTGFVSRFFDGFLQQAPEQDQPGGDGLGDAIPRRGFSHSIDGSSRRLFRPALQISPAGLQKKIGLITEINLGFLGEQQ